MGNKEVFQEKEEIMAEILLSKELALAELDNYFASAHKSCMPDDDDFECNIQDCPQIFYQLRQIVADYFKE